MALEKAISNVNKYFSVIGISEQFHHYIEALEHQFPEYFRGILYLYNTLGTNLTRHTLLVQHIRYEELLVENTSHVFFDVKKYYLVKVTVSRC